MKTDLATSIGIAIVGAVIAFVICNFLIGPIEPVSFQTIDSGSDIDASLAAPNVDVFNYKALNPTVEVYVGDCGESSENEECQ